MRKTLCYMMPLILQAVLAWGQGTWTPIGPDDKNQAFPSGQSISQAVYNGEVYAAGLAINNAVLVRKYSNGAWVDAAPLIPSIPGTSIPSPVICFDNTGALYLAYTAFNNGYKVRLKKLIGGSWVAVGDTISGVCNKGKMLISGGNIYLAFANSGNSYIYTSDGYSWTNITPTVTGKNGEPFDLKLDNSGNPLFCYQRFLNNYNAAECAKYTSGSWTTIATTASIGINFVPIETLGLAFAAPSTYYLGVQLAGNTQVNIQKKVGIQAITSLGQIATGKLGDMQTDNSGMPYFVYANANNGNKIAVKKYDGTSWTDIGGSISIGDGTNNYTLTARLIFDNSSPVISYYSGNARIARYNGSNWDHLGIATGITASAGNYPFAIAESSNGSLFFVSDAVLKTYSANTWSDVLPSATTTYYGASLTTDASNGLYLMCADATQSGKATVQKYDGANWTTIGPSAFSNGNITASDICIAASNPAVIYLDYSLGNKAVTKIFDGSSWVNGPVSTGVSESVSITNDASGNIYAAYTDADSGHKAVVKQYINGSWNNVGMGTATDTIASNLNIAVNSFGTIYLSYTNGSDSAKIGVREFNGTAWVNTGGQFIPGSQFSSYPDMILGADDSLYISYGRGSQSQIIVQKYDGNTWSNEGNVPINDGLSLFSRIVHVQPGVLSCIYAEGCIYGRSLLTFTPAPVTISTNVALPVCANTAITFTASPVAGGNPVYKWRKNGNIVTSATSNTYTETTPVDGDIIDLIVSTSISTDTSASITVVLDTAVMWTGSAGNGVWNDAQNWSCGNIPTTADDVVIPQNATITILGQNAICDHLTVNPGTTISISGAGALLHVTGTMINNGTISTSSGGTLQVDNL